MAKSVFYVTTALPYPNGAPHIGHAYEMIAADALARFKRCDGYDVFFMTGTDEHGLKMQQAAHAAGIPVRDLADRNVAQFQKMVKILDISCNRFIRTTDGDHYVSAQAMWEAMDDNGDIYKDSYSGWYSVRDEAYYQEKETEVRNDGKRYAIGTGTPVEWTVEESYFFRLSSYRERLLDFYGSNPGFIAPATRRNEVINFVKGGLEDLSISRTTFDWGISVPQDPEHVMYVWVDALANYVTGAGYPDVDSPAFRKLWPANVHVIGKDILRFHAIYWPAFLMSAGLPLPRQVFAHGFLTNDGEKMSKSVGNVVDPFELVDMFGLDAVRYFLLRSVPFAEDGSYSAAAIIARMNADLANDLGNLAQRSLSMVAKNLKGSVPAPNKFMDEDQEILAAAAQLLEKVRADYDNLVFHRALERIWTVVADANRYFTEQRPWILRVQDPQRMKTVLYVTLEVIRRTALLLQPVMPNGATRLLNQIGVPRENRGFAAFDASLTAGTGLPEPQPVFPRYEP